MKQFSITQKFTKRDTLSLESYFKEISKIPLLTKEEEEELTSRLINGDEIAKQKLIKSNLRFVVSIAKQYVTNKSHLEDLINEGNLGLIESAEKFDPKLGYKFFSYGVWWIRKSIIEYLNKNNRTVRIPINKLVDINTINKKLNYLEQKYSREVSANELLNDESLNDLGFDDDSLKNIITIMSTTVESYDKRLNTDENSDTLLDLLTSEKQDYADHLVMDTTEFFLNQLNDLEKNILIDYLGLNGEEPLTLSEMGKKYGYSREMIRQIKFKSLRKLKYKYKKYESKYN